MEHENYIIDNDNVGLMEYYTLIIINKKYLIEFINILYSKSFKKKINVFRYLKVNIFHI